jgi:predicted permease
MEVEEFSSNPQVLISENYWRKRFGGERTIIGKTIYLNGVAVTVAGITPHDFAGTGMGAPAFWLPISAEPLVHASVQWLKDRENQQYRLFGRLASGVSMSQAQAQVNPIAEYLRSQHNPRSEWAKPATVLVWPGSPFPLPLKEYGGGLTLAILLIMAAAGMVLVVACANVGSLQLARARFRQNELRTRLSLGASRMRLVRQLVTESALVATLAGGVALLFTWALLKGAVKMMANAVPGEYGGLVFDVAPDLEVFVFVSAVSLIAGMLSGFAPAMESSRARLTSGVAGATEPVRGRRLQDALVASQVALSLVLMIIGSTAVRSSIRTVAIDTGYESKRVFALDVQFPDTMPYAAQQRRSLIDQLRTRLAAFPGVEAVTNAKPPGDAGLRTPAAALDGAPSQTRNAQTRLHYAYVEPNFFASLAIPITLGRGFSGQADRAVVVSESAARELWPGQSPIGRSLGLGPTDERSHNLSDLAVEGPAYQVVGVARNTRTAEFHASDSKRVYLPMPADRLQFYPILIRTRSEPAQIVSGLDPILTSIDPNMTASCSTLEEMQRQSAPFIVAAFAALIASSIGLVGLVLALIGIYGTVTYIVVLRTREVGIRMAIGAQKSNVLGLILRESARPILAGLIAGSLLAVGASYLARGLLYGLKDIDGVSVAGVSLLFLIVGLLASYPPARRATRVDPLVALRHE